MKSYTIVVCHREYKLEMIRRHRCHTTQASRRKCTKPIEAFIEQKGFYQNLSTLTTSIPVIGGRMAQIPDSRRAESHGLEYTRRRKKRSSETRKTCTGTGRRSDREHLPDCHPALALRSD
jgi:hypothetical protein